LQRNATGARIKPEQGQGQGQEGDGSGTPRNDMRAALADAHCLWPVNGVWVCAAFIITAIVMMNQHSKKEKT